MESPSVPPAVATPDDAVPPATPTSPASGSSAGAQSPASSAAAQIRGGLSSVVASLNPLAQKVNLGFYKVTQLAEEQIGTADKTQLSEEYRALEAKVDRIRAMHENLIRATSQFLSPGPSTAIKLQVADVVSNVAGAVSAPADSTVERLRSLNLDTTSNSQVLGSHFTKAGEALGDATPLGSALFKCGDAHDKLGRARLQMNLDVHEKFVRQMMANLDSSIKQAMQCRKAVSNARVQLDTYKKARAHATRPETIARAQEDLETAQRKFDSAVEAATVAMEAVIASPEPLVCLADFMAAMLDYFQRGRDLLAELAPEIDAIRVAHEARTDDERLRVSMG